MKKYFSSFWNYRELILELVKRDLTTKYRRSALGYLWSLLNPLLMMIVISAVFSTVFRYDIPNFPIYLLAGQVCYSFFSEATSIAMSSILGNGPLIKKVYIPKYILPLAKCMSAFVNLMLSLVAIIIVMIATKTPVTPAILLAPLPLLYLFVFAVGVGMILSVLAVYFRDVVHLYSIILLAWMYFTPIFYPVSILPNPELMNLNPLYHIITCFRNIILDGTIFPLGHHIIAISVALVTLVIGLLVFKYRQDDFIIHM